MRMCGHAHHDDMLYLGRDPQPSWEYPPLAEQGYANRELYEYWAARDPTHSTAEPGLSTVVHRFVHRAVS